MTRPTSPARPEGLLDSLRAFPPLVVARETLLAVLPAVLTVALLFLATQPAYSTLINQGNGWTPYAYQGLAQDVQSYHVAVLTPGLSDTERLDSRDRALSSASNPQQFSKLNSVESYGEARLNDVARLLRLGTPESAALAAREAVQLNAQAASYAKDVGNAYVAALTFMRRALLGTAVVTGLLSMLLTLRAALLWRAERERRSRREARQREALRLASHELRRPLQALLLASDLLKSADTTEDRERLLTMIEDSTLQLAARADLTRLNDLYLDVTLHVQHVDLRPLLRRFSGARVTVTLPDQPLTWPVDPDRFRQIIENLLENALKYTDGPVQVTLSLLGGQPDIQVRDHGPGLNAEQLEQVFLPYERGPRGLREGQGLGLPLVRRYARAHGGDVTLRPAPDGGLIATVHLGDPAPTLAEPRRGALRL